jgi:hypothetical protein
MPFPSALNPLKQHPTTSEYIRLAATEDHDALLRKASRVAATFKGLADTQPAKAAAVVYIGLCALKEFTDTAKISEGIGACKAIVDKYVGNANLVDGKSYNCSYFSSDAAAGFNDHGVAIKRACDVYLNSRRSRRVRCFMLLALGAEYHGKVQIPVNDEWLQNFIF